MPRFLPEPALPFAQQQRTAVLLLQHGKHFIERGGAAGSGILRVKRQHQ